MFQGGLNVEDYCLKYASPKYKSDDAFLPDAVPRLTQTTIGLIHQPNCVPKLQAETKVLAPTSQQLDPCCSKIAQQASFEHRQNLQRTIPICRCDTITPPWWHSPTFWWRDNLVRLKGTVGNINDYDLVGSSAERTKPADMLHILEIECPERYIPGQIHRSGIKGIFDKCLERHKRVDELALIQMGVCPSKDAKLSSCICEKPVPEPKKKKKPSGCRDLGPKKHDRIPYCSEHKTVEVLTNVKLPCPCHQTEGKFWCHDNVKISVTEKQLKTTTAVGQLKCPKYIPEEEIFEDDGAMPGFKEENQENDCLCPDNQRQEVRRPPRVKQDEACGSTGQVRRPCNTEPYILHNFESTQACRDKLRVEELSKVGLPFKAEACIWYNKLFPPLQTRPAGRTEKKIFPNRNFCNM